MNKSYPIIRAIAKRDIRRWFSNPTGYVFISLFVLVCAVFLFLWGNEFFTNNIASLDSLNDVYPYLLIFFIPAVTMGIWSGERGQGTDELLLTLPASDLQIVLGKYLAAAGIYTFALAFTLPQIVVLLFLGTPDLGLIFGNYLGFWLLGLTLIGAGMIGSQLSDNLTISLILGAIFCTVVVMFEWLLGLVSVDLARTWLLFFPVAVFREMGQGLVPLTAILLYGGLSAAFIYMNLLLLSRRHWRGTEGLHRGLRFVALVLGTIGLTVLGSNCGGSVDTTAERVHSLSDQTLALLGELDANRPVNITAFISPEVTRDYVETRRNLRNLLRRFSSEGGNAIRLRLLDTERFSDEARLAKDQFGIEAHTVREREEGRLRTRDIFLGVAFTCGPEEVVLPFIYNKLPIEYEFMRSIRVVSQAKRRKLGVLKSDVDLFGSFDFQRGGSSPEWEIIRELKLQYEVVRVDPDKDYPEGLNVLLAPMASSLTQEQMDRLATFVKAGHPTLFLDDPMPFSAPNAAPDQPKGGPRNPMMGGPPPGQKGDFRALLAGLDIRWNPYEIVWDYYNPHPEIEPLVDPEVVCIARDSGGTAPFNPNEEITSGLQEVFAWFGGALDEGTEAGITFTSLLRSSGQSGLISKHEVFTPGFFGQPSLNRFRRHTRRMPDRTMACRVRGTPQGGEKSIDAIFIADLDMVASIFFVLRRETVEQGGIDLDLDNVTFVLNCIDDLAGDKSFIELRKRRPRFRTLTTVEKANEVFDNDYTKEVSLAEEKAEKERQAAQKRLDDAVKKVEKSTTLDERSKEIRIQSIREVEQRRFDVAKAKIDDAKAEAIAQANATKIRKQRFTERFYGVLGIILSPLLSILVGVGVLISKIRRERMGVPAGRAAGGAA